MRVRAIMVTLLLLAFCGGVAQARDPDLPRPDPKGVWRYVWDGHSTSTCLGNPKTPVCAIETIIVCRYRSDRKLCLTADYPAAGDDRLGLMPLRLPMNLTIHLRFRVGGSVRLRSVDIKPLPDSPLYRAGRQEHAGDLAVEIVNEECWTQHKEERRCQHYAGRETWVWVVRQVGERWAIISGSPDSEHTRADFIELIHRK